MSARLDVPVLNRTFSRPLVRNLLGGVWLATGLVTLYVALEPVIVGDGQMRYNDLLRIMNGQRPSEKYSVVQELLSLPLYRLGRYFGEAQFAVSLFNFFVLIGLLVAVWVIIPRHGLKVAILLLAASMFPSYANYYFGEMLTALFVMVGLWLAKRNWALSVLLIGLGVANTPATIPAAAIVAIYYFFAARRTSVAVGTVLAGLVMLLETRWKFGGLLASPYLSSIEHGIPNNVMPYSGLAGFSYPLVLGVLSILFSFGKGLLFFMPSLPLALKKYRPTMPAETTQLVNGLLLFTVGLVLVYSRWWAWYGGVAWGPRMFMVASLPATVLLAFKLKKGSNAGLALVVLASGWICVEGVLFGLNDFSKCVADDYRLELLCWYTPEYSPIFNPFVSGVWPLPPERFAYAVWCAITVIVVAVVFLWGRPRIWSDQVVSFARDWPAGWRQADAHVQTVAKDGSVTVVTGSAPVVSESERGAGTSPPSSP